MSEVAQILLVEDDPQDRNRAVEALSRGGFRVTEVTDGAECLRALSASREFVVLMGLKLPDMDGRDLLARIAASHPDTPAVVVTRIADLEVAVDAIKCGAWDYVVKRPDVSHLDDLPHVVARMLERRRRVRERNRYREEVDALAIALRGTADGVMIIDAGGRITFVNRALAEAWKQPEAAIVGRPLEEFVVVPRDADPLTDILEAVAEQGRWGGELRTRGAEPPEGVWDVTLTPIRPGEAYAGPDGAARSVIGIFRDSSEAHALEQLRADFLSMITHDIKVPLTVILGYTEMLTDPEPPPGEIPKDILTRIRESGERIHALVCNFLDLSRIEAGRLRLDMRPFDLRAMLANTMEQHGASARRKGLSLELAGELLQEVVADELQLERVVTNLLANAIKYTPSGGSITVSTARREGRISVAVQDTGRGIPPDEIPHLFEKYRRVREAKRTEGTGLGLFIAKTIVEAHGGDIRVESAPGVGSTFTLLLPAVRASCA
jgi:two-component system, OmpR family, phosphate regulon sensor histidine kinase PhoR